MVDTDRDTCSICWDAFRTPKLLPCRHTFCAKCLQRFVKNSDVNETLKCPLCRAVCAIPSTGISGFLDNYFVSDTDSVNVKIDIVKHCDMCKNADSKNIKVCSHCGQNMCISCASSHKKALILSGASGLKSDTESSSDAESENENELHSRSNRRRNSYDVSLPFNLYMSLGFIRSKCVVSLVSSFVVDMLPDTSGRQFINAVFPISDRECWVLPTAGPTVLRYNISGKIERVIPIHHDTVGDLVCLQNGTLLLAFINSKMIIKYEFETLNVFTHTRKYHPFGITAFPDGRIAIVGSTAFNDEESPDREGELQIYSEDGNILTRIGRSKEQSLLKHPFSVIFNKFSNRIFVSDRAKNCVYIFSEDGLLVEQYEGGGRHSRFRLFQEENSFRPLRMCEDIFGNVIVIEACSRSLHLLDKNGKFTGLILTDDTRNFGNPLCIATDPKGKIWIGDNNDRKVRVFESKAFINELNTDRQTIPSFPFHVPLDFHGH